MRRRHPSALELGAWFDRESCEHVGPHLAECNRCRGAIHRLRRVRAALRGQPSPPPLPALLGLKGARRWQPAVPSLAILIVLGLATAVLLPVERIGNGSRSYEAQSEGPASPAGSGQPAQPGEAASGGEATLSQPSPPVAPSRNHSTLPPKKNARRALRLGVAVPTTGSSAEEGTEVLDAVRRAIAGANAAGGVGGRPVEMVALPAETADPAALPAELDALVGGFGISPVAGVSWLLPADPAIEGTDVIPAELSPRAVGARLGADLDSRKFIGAVGVVVGEGPDAALADGLGSQFPIFKVRAAPDTSCESELLALRRAEVVALAVAGPPDLAGRCAYAAIGAGWHPPGGLLLAPSAAYARLNLLAAVQGARTVLGLPWPTSQNPGSVRFQVALLGSRSYRALVSFAAAELAVQMARSKGSVSAESARSGGSWRSDLLELEGAVNRGAVVVVAGPDGWMPLPLPTNKPSTLPVG